MRRAIGLCLLLATTACADPSPLGAGTPWRFDLPPGIPEPVIPEGNPMTHEKVELGRHLFYDVRLSGTSSVACSTCHEPEDAFGDRRRFSEGAQGQLLPHNSLTLTNAAYAAPLTWANPGLGDLEGQVLVPLFAEFPVEMEFGGHEAQIFERLRNDDVYAELFAAAYPDDDDPIRLAPIRDAIATFVRALVSTRSPHDRYVFEGDHTALSDAALRGMALFRSDRLRCSQCHAGFNFTVATRTVDAEPPRDVFFNTGLYNVDGGYPTGVEGLFESTSEPEDRGRFRPPTLRNIALTAPYLHDGSAQTLREVIAIYERGGRASEHGDGRDNPGKDPRISGFALTDAERDDLVAFLESLTDWEFVTDPQLANPWPEGSPARPREDAPMRVRFRRPTMP